MNSRLVGRFAESLLLCLALACGGAPDDSNVFRGRGLKAAAVSPAAEAAIYQAAVHASFDPDPSLVLLVHARKLPTVAGYDGGAQMPAALVTALRDRDVVSGTCDPTREAAKTPRCPGSRTGYVIRGSPVMQVGRDTVQMNFAAEVFGPDKGTAPQSLRFEKIYQFVGSGTQWRVAREARVRLPN